MALVLHLQLEDDYNDATGTHTATAAGSQSFVDGKLGRAINLTNTGRITIGGGFRLPTTCTITAWVNLNVAASTRGKHMSLIAQWDVADDRTYFFINQTGDYLAVFGRRNGSITTVSGASTEFVKPAGVWQHVAWVLDDAAGTITTYVDGVTNAGPIASYNSPLADATVEIGDTTNGNQDFDGKVDDLRIYDHALTPAEVAALASPVRRNTLGHVVSSNRRNTLGELVAA
ncbi:MAG: LamG domain-containing protein [Planctomycetota bacterium]